ncbi:MAG: NAD-dependent epimerase/dehydratase family protein [Actinomycetota bacterium]
MRVLVTGAAGFIGSHVAERLADSGHDVVGIDDLSTGEIGNVPVGIEFEEASILDEVRLAAAIGGADSVVHLAARPSVPRSIEEPMRSHHANATGTLNVLQAARRLDHPHVIVASSSSVYGANPTLPKHEELAAQPLSPYAVSKLAAEQYALAWQQSYGVGTLAFRFFNVYGPRQAPGHAYAAVIPAFVHAALAGEPLTIHGDGTQSRDFTYVGTVTDVITSAVESRTTCPSPVNLAFGTRTTLLEMIGTLGSVLGRPLERNHVNPRAGDVAHSQADNSLLRSLVPDVQPVELADGLRRTIDWMTTAWAPTTLPS